MIANVSTPLLGVVDTMIIGQAPDPALIGSVAIASLIFTFIYWGFGFLRMGTAGLTAQALGADDHGEIRATLGRSILLAVTIGIILISLQHPISELAFYLIQGSFRVELLAKEYFDIRIWSAPATLTNYVVLGWLIAIGKARHALALQLLLNISNMLMDIFFVLGLGMGVKGVALGTLLSEYGAAGIGVFTVFTIQKQLPGSWNIKRILAKEKVLKSLSVNGDILIRSLALIVVFTWFTASSAALGDVTLAANAVLLHFLTVSAYFLDGIALAAEKFIGESVGQRSKRNFIDAARLTTIWAAGIAGFNLVLSPHLWTGNYQLHDGRSRCPRISQRFCYLCRISAVYRGLVFSARWYFYWRNSNLFHAKQYAFFNASVLRYMERSRGFRQSRPMAFFAESFYLPNNHSIP